MTAIRDSQEDIHAGLKCDGPRECRVDTRKLQDRVADQFEVAGELPICRGFWPPLLSVGYGTDSTMTPITDTPVSNIENSATRGFLAELGAFERAVRDAKWPSLVHDTTSSRCIRYGSASAVVA